MSELRLLAALSGLCAVALAASGVRAESLPVGGVLAPEAGIPATAELIEIERFDGDLGQDLELSLTDLLGEVRVRGELWFDIAGPGALDDAVIEVEAEDGTTYLEPVVADARLRGTLRSEIIDRNIDPKRKTECLKRNDDDECIEEKQIVIECTELTVRVDPRLLMTGADGERLYSYQAPRSAVERYCADDSEIPSTLAMANALVDQIARTVRRDLAPRSYRSSERVMERRRGLEGDDRRAFRDAVKLVDDDGAAACSAFAGLEQGNPNHLSVLFNIGLCHESNNRLALAATYYERALAVDADHDYPRRGLSRIRAREEGEAFLAARGL